MLNKDKYNNSINLKTNKNHQEKLKKIFYQSKNSNNDKIKIENVLVLPFNDKLANIKIPFRIINVNLVFSF